MVYKNKARDMKRAPLPSRADTYARAAKRRARKDARRHGKRVAHTARTRGWDEAVEHFDPKWDNQHGPKGSWDRPTRRVVRRRRDADNLGALMRWAQALADRNPDASPDELRLKVREIIGWDYMADHLMTHVENIDAFNINPVYRRWYYPSTYSGPTREELVNELILHCQDLWLSGQNKQLHKYASKCTSNRQIRGWERKTYREPIYRRTFNDHTKIYATEFTGEYKLKEYWVRRCLSYDEIPMVVEGWFRANYSSAKQILHPH